MHDRDARRKESQENNLYQLTRDGNQSLIHCVWKLHIKAIKNLNSVNSVSESVKFGFVRTSSFHYLTQNRYSLVSILISIHSVTH